VIGNVADFDAAGIDITTERRSLDSIRTFKHIELLSDAEFENVRFDAAFEFKSDAAMDEMLQGEDWSSPGE